MKGLAPVIALLIAGTASLLFVLARPGAEASPDATITVDSTADTNTRDTVLTLREAMLLATGGLVYDDLTDDEKDNVSGTPGAAEADTIAFSVAGIISPTTALPDLSTPNTTIAGASQTVTIYGGNLPEGTSCLTISSSGNVVRGLVITGCPANGITVTGADNTIGGTIAAERNVINGNGQHGLLLVTSGATGNVIIGNYIGTNSTGDAAVSNGLSGVPIAWGASGNTVGGATAGERNVISGNVMNGVGVVGEDSTGNLVEGNYIGVNASGTAAVPNADGVGITNGASSNTVRGNVISGNSESGVSVGTQLYSLAGSTSLPTLDPIAVDDQLEVLLNGEQIFLESSPSGSLGPVMLWANEGDSLEVRASTTIDDCGSIGPVWLVHWGSGESVQLTAGADNGCPGPMGEFWSWSGTIDIPVAPYGPASANVIQGNYIGTNAAGDAAIPNGENGIEILGSSSGTIVGGSGNVISGNDGSGIEIKGGSENDVIKGNYIGTDATGNSALSNGGAGIQVSDGANGTQIGGTTAVERNVVSGNLFHGVRVTDTATAVSVTGNYIGTSKDGDAAIPNPGGVVLAESGGNTIGGPSAGEGNVISGNSGPGAVINGEGATGNVVEGNYIGTDAAGVAALPNSVGVQVVNGAHDNTVWSNVISGNEDSGVDVGGLLYSLNGGPWPFAPIDIDDQLEVQLNGETIFLESTSTGSVDAPALVASPDDSLRLIASSTIDDCGSIGTVQLFHMWIGEWQQLTAGADNGCSGTGVFFDETYTITIPADPPVATANVIQGNYIGTNAAGDAAIPNGGNGIEIRGVSSGTVVGGSGNVISGNNGNGIEIKGGSQNDVIKGNYIGTDASGTVALGNGGAGIRIYQGAQGATIGSTVPAERNIVSGNQQEGIVIEWGGTTGNNVIGNYIGTNSTGDAPIPNSYGGIRVCCGASGNVVGGPTTPEGNVISGNNGPAIRISMGGADLNVVQNNYIGVDAGGSTGLPNWRGVWIDDGASDNTVQDNVISGNNETGVRVGQLMYALSGSATDATPIDVDDQLEVLLNGQTIFLESTGTGSLGPVFMDSAPGDSLEVHASSTIDDCGSIGPLWLIHLSTGEAEQLTVGADNGCSGTGEFWSTTYSIAIPAAPYSASGNVIQGNYIGTNAAGDAAIPNVAVGVHIAGSSSGTVVGGSSPGEGNVISGNTWGVLVASGGSTGNQIIGNYIGTDSTGSTAIGNRFDGVAISGGVDNVVGGPTEAERNIISGNGASGVDVLAEGATGNLVEGNYIGLNAAGTVALPNGWGVLIFDGADGNTVRGNTISGNDGAGVTVGQLLYWLSGDESNIFAPIALDDDLEVLVNGVTLFHESTDIGWWWLLPFGANPGDTLEVRASSTIDDCGSIGPLWLHHVITGEVVQLTAGANNGCPGPMGEFWSWSGTIDIPVAPYGPASGNVIQDNYIGTNPAGDTAIPNGGSGIEIAGSSSDTIVGGSGNVISGNNGDGILIRGGSQNDVIKGNYIGTDATGNNALSNGSDGIEISEASGTTIGGTTAADRNVISGHGMAGVWLRGTGVAGVNIIGNYIGTRVGGDASIPNNWAGIRIDNGASGNTVGGPAAGEGNVISGNTNAAGYSSRTSGVQIAGADTSGNVVEGNYIGLDAAGAVPIPNEIGVHIFDGASGNTVRGNTISGNSGAGVSVGRLGYTLTGSPSGMPTGVSYDDCLEVLINGETYYSTCVSLGPIFPTANMGDSLQLRVTATDDCGSIGSIWLRGGGESVQLTAGADNGCSGAGVFFDETYTITIPADPPVASGNVIQDNYIGTNPAGDAPIPNGGTGIEIAGSSSDTIVGGSGNVISGNSGEGIVIRGGSQNDVIQGNHIGVNAAGNAPLGNGANGIHFGGPLAPAGVGTLIGGPGTGEGNVIGGNGIIGIDLKHGVYDVVVQGNVVGTDISGMLSLGNAENGILIHEGAHDNLIGGTGPGEGNVIAFNQSSGVGVFGTTSVRNSIRGNSIYSNSGSGIDAWDGGNTELQPPTITGIGSVSGTACPFCWVEVFSDDDGEGRYFHPSPVQANGAGEWQYPGYACGPNVTATATDADGNTSEFSQPFSCGTDSDGDGLGDNCDPCAGQQDCDSDSFNDYVEAYVGTDPLDDCADTPVRKDEDDDRWPLDMDDNQKADTGDVLTYAGLAAPPTYPGHAGWTPRLDLNSDGKIDTGDVLKYAGIAAPPTYCTDT